MGQLDVRLFDILEDIFGSASFPQDFLENLASMDRGLLCPGMRCADNNIAALEGIDAVEQNRDVRVGRRNDAGDNGPWDGRPGSGDAFHRGQ